MPAIACSPQPAMDAQNAPAAAMAGRQSKVFRMQRYPRVFLCPATGFLLLLFCLEAP